MKLTKGTTLQNGKYTIDKALGQGSFGITYLATAKFVTDSGLGKIDVIAKVAIKEFFMSEVNVRKGNGSTVEGSLGSVFTYYRKKFRKEAENLSKLAHPNIVKVFDVFDENNTTYYVMEFLDGQNLDDYIKQKGHLNEAESIAVIKEVGGALAYMHSKKMLHLDIKPKNIMRKQDGKCYLIDFGISKQYTENGEPESSTTIGLGTPGYAPLEQSQYKQDGTFPATIDVYALGATLFKMLTGKRPPEATSILNEGFPIKQMFSIGISKNTTYVLKKAMEPIKRNRYEEIGTFTSELPIYTNLSNQNTDNRILNDSDETLIRNSNKEDNKIALYKRKSFGLIIGIVGCLMLLMMSPGKYDFDALDTDGVQLVLLFGVATIGASVYFIAKHKRLGRIWTRLKGIFILVFVANTLLLGMWNHSLTAAYLTLSIGLLWDIIILYIYSVNHEQN